MGPSPQLWENTAGHPPQPTALTRPYPPSPELPISAEVALAVPFSSDITQRPREGNSETCISHQTTYWGFYSHFSQFTMKPGNFFFSFLFLSVLQADPVSLSVMRFLWWHRHSGPLDFHLTLSNPHSLNAPQSPKATRRTGGTAATQVRMRPIPGTSLAPKQARDSCC